MIAGRRPAGDGRGREMEEKTGGVESNAKHIAGLMKLLANENRLLIFCCLIDRSMTVGEMKRCIPKITQSALSQHLALLRAHGVVDFVKTGQNVTYFIADERVRALMGVLKESFCK